MFVFAFLFVGAKGLWAQASDSFLMLNGERVSFEGSAIQLPFHSFFAEDQKANWTPEDVFAGKFDQHFIKHDELFGNFSFTQSAYWLRFEIDLEQSQVSDEILLVMNAATLDEVALYIQNEAGLITRKESGYRLGVKTRDVRHHNYIFRVNPAQGEKFLMRAKTNTSLVFPLEAWRESDFHQQNYIDVILMGVYLGVLAAMFFYNAFIYVSTREHAYLFYILFIISYGLLQSTLDGLLGLWVWGDTTALRGYDMMILPSLSGGLAILFSANFLRTKEALPKSHRLMMATVVLLMLTIILNLVSNGQAIQISAYLSLWVTILLFTVGVLALRAGQLGARFFMLAWLFLIVGTATYLIHLLGVFTNMLVLVYSMKTGSSIEILLLSLGLADRFNQERRLKEKLETEKNEIENRAQVMATVDTRTGMPNRAQLQQQIAAYNKEKKDFCLVLMKVRGFKQINNTLGHENGDELLKLVGLKIDSVLAGDQFMTLSVGENGEGLPGNVAVVDSLTFAFILSDYESNELEDVAITLKEGVSGTIEFQEIILDIEILLGLTDCDSKEEKNSHRIVHEAQVALAAAAKFERQIGLYSPLIDPYSENQLSLMGHLRTAVADEALDLYCQPQLEMNEMKLVGFESLLRWKNEKGEFVSPDSFIPLAESCGVIRPLTRWVIRQSLLRLRELQKRFPEAKVSINLSVSNLREDDLVHYVRNQLQELAVKPDCVKFEITESSMIENEETALSRLLRLRRLGCRVSIDDYGSGYASLGYLKQLPISEVKIDRSFIQGLVENIDDQVIVKATISMCHDLGLQVVAEGVETEEVLRLLKSFGCDVVQGYLLGRPVQYTKEVVDEWVKSGEQHRLN
jgi:EAL domain-containing protein (putative c-di-GMP-specific phosphodiesterase class I)/GGDEF domain-containing protein